MSDVRGGHDCLDHQITDGICGVCHENVTRPFTGPFALDGSALSSTDVGRVRRDRAIEDVRYWCGSFVSYAINGDRLSCVTCGATVGHMDKVGR